MDRVVQIRWRWVLLPPASTEMLHRLWRTTVQVWCMQQAGLEQVPSKPTHMESSRRMGRTQGGEKTVGRLLTWLDTLGPSAFVSGRHREQQQQAAGVCGKHVASTPMPVEYTWNVGRTWDKGTVAGRLLRWLDTLGPDGIASRCCDASSQAQVRHPLQPMHPIPAHALANDRQRRCPAGMPPSAGMPLVHGWNAARLRCRPRLECRTAGMPLTLWL